MNIEQLAIKNLEAQIEIYKEIVYQQNETIGHLTGSAEISCKCLHDSTQNADSWIIPVKNIQDALRNLDFITMIRIRDKSDILYARLKQLQP